jgi:hypothetical protein
MYGVCCTRSGIFPRRCGWQSKMLITLETKLGSKVSLKLVA